MRGSLLFRPIARNPTSTHYRPCPVTFAVNEYLCDVPPDGHAPPRSLVADRVAAQKKEEAMDMDVGRAAESQRAARLLSRRRRRQRPVM